MNSIKISLLILASCALISLILILRSKWLQSKKNIKDYEEGRDKLTYRKPKEDSPETSSSVGILTNMIGGFIVILVAWTLFGSVQDATNEALQTNANVTVTSNMVGATSTVLSLVPILFALLIGFSILYYAFQITQNLRGVGVV